MNKRDQYKLTILIAVLLMVGGTCIAAPIPSDVKTVVAFIFVENQKGELIPNGTSFFVSVQNPRVPATHATYLVTAKHVLCKPDSTEFYTRIFVRLNRKQGGADIGPIPINAFGDNKNVFVHNDPSVDIAVIPFMADQSKYEFRFLPADMVTTREAFKQMKIREGSDVFFTGLFVPFPGSEKNYPVVRFGRVALVTEEKITWKNQPMDLYLIEAGSYGGNSGSPVFFYLGSDREPGTLTVGSPVLKLAGVMQGTFLDTKEIQVIETKKVPVSVSNMGIAAVVPAYKLHEILYGDEIKKRRGF